MIYDCAIIGSGPAGMAAAIHMKRLGKNVVLFEKGQVGGLLREANAIENYLGASAGISGKKLAFVFKGHLDRFSIPLIKEEVLGIKKKAHFEVATKKRRVAARCVIIATGTEPKAPEISIPKALQGRKVFYSILDLPAPRKTDKQIIVIGGGDTGFDYALNLKRMGFLPTIITRGKAGCLPLLKKRAEKSGIALVEHAAPRAIKKTGGKLCVECVGKVFKTNLVMMATGRRPAMPRFDGAKSCKGLFLAGDVRGLPFRQAQIAAGDGLLAAMEAEQFLNRSRCGS